MDMYGKTSRSIPQKLVMLGLEICILAASYWILFLGGYNMFFPSNSLEGVFARHLTTFIFNCIVFARMLVTFFYLVKRAIPWEEAFDVPFAFAVYYIGFALLGYTSGHPLDVVDVLGIVIFFIGSFLNTFGELQRDAWKKKPENKGHLYTGGLFRYSMHINYFGDVLWVSAYAILTRNWYSAIIPAFLFVFFATYNIPKLDKYLRGKYGAEHEEYSRKSKRFIPFVY